MSGVFTTLFFLALGLLCLYQGLRKVSPQDKAMDLRPRWLRCEGGDTVGQGLAIALGVAFLTIGVAIIIISLATWLKS